MCVYLYMHNKYTQHTQTHILYYVNKNLFFWMWLIAINRLTALIIIIIILHKSKLIAYIFLSPFAHSG